MQAMDQAQGKDWTLINADCVEALAAFPDASIDLVCSSIPFSNLYSYSASERDMGNVRNDAEFFAHLAHLTVELRRVVKPGRLLALHVRNRPTFQTKDGVAGLYDFRGDTIRHYQQHGFVYHAEICIQKNPQSEAIRHHPRGMLFVQLERDAAWMRQGLADYVVVMRAPGDNPTPIQADVSHEEWIRWAHPVWTDIRETDVLPTIAAKDQEDERHICPLQLPVVERCVRLWSNPGEVVLDPFSGIGSVGYGAIKAGRKYCGIELKPSYHKVSVGNLKEAETAMQQTDLFALAGIEVAF